MNKWAKGGLELQTVEREINQVTLHWNDIKDKVVNMLTLNVFSPTVSCCPF